MTKAEEAWEAIENAEAEAEARDDWRHVLSLCRKALEDAPSAPLHETHRVKRKLAYALVEERTNREQNLRDAISVYEELLQGAEPESERWLTVHSGLGQAFSGLVAVSNEKPSEILKSVAFHYEQALRGPISAPELRASIEAQAAYALMYIGGEERAKEYLVRALTVFTREEFPEEFEEVSEALAKIEQKGSM